MNRSGTGFMRTKSSADSAYKAQELLGLGFISNYAIVDSGFFFVYTEKGCEFAETVSTEAKEVGLSNKEYVDVFMNLQSKGGANGEEVGDEPS